jgi:hypothetical protein
MKKIIAFLFLLFTLFNFKAYAIDFQVFDMRNKLFEEAKEIRLLLPKSKDAVFLTAMFDSCIIATSQLDAYFSMLGIFESIKKRDLNDAPIDFIVNWLNEIKKTNEINIKMLTSVTQQIDSATRVHIKKLEAFFKELTGRINAELDKFSSIRASLKLKKR